MNFPVIVKSADFSFNSKSGKKVALTLSSFSDRLVVTISELGKVGHVIDLYFPHAYSELANIAYHRPEFETKVVFGPDTGNYDLFISRLAACLCRLHFDNKPVRLLLGLERLSDEEFLQEILDNLEQKSSQ